MFAMDIATAASFWFVRDIISNFFCCSRRGLPERMRSSICLSISSVLIHFSSILFFKSSTLSEPNRSHTLQDFVLFHPLLQIWWEDIPKNASITHSSFWSRSSTSKKSISKEENQEQNPRASIFVGSESGKWSPPRPLVSVDKRIKTSFATDSNSKLIYRPMNSRE